MIPYFSTQYFNIGSLRFYTWGIFIALAFLIGLILAVKEAKKSRIEAVKIINLVIFIYIGAMIGARIFFVLQWPKDFLSDPIEFFKITQGGLMMYGGLFGGLLAGWLYARKIKNHWMLADTLAPLIALGLAIGRIGCFLLNDHQGGLTSLPWAIHWPDSSLRHPVALYLILFDLALAGFLWWYRKKAKWAGQVFFVFMVIYSAGRFLLDFTRDIDADPHILGLATSQLISLAVLAILLFWLIKKTSLSLPHKNIYN